MLAVVLVDFGADEDVEVITVVRRRVDRTERGPGLAKRELVTETTGETLAEVIPMRRRAR